MKKSWSKATRKIEYEIKNSEVYKAAFEHLRAIYGERVNKYTLNRLVSKVISDYLYNKQFDDENITSLIQILFNGLKEEPLIYGAEVLLQGIVLLPDKVEVSHGVVLRKISKEDLEKESPLDSMAFSQRSYFSTPSAILNIEFCNLFL